MKEEEGSMQSGWRLESQMIILQIEPHYTFTHLYIDNEYI